MAALADDTPPSSPSVGDGPMRLFVKSASLQSTYRLNVSPDTTIAEAKALLAPLFEVTPSRLRIIFAGPELSGEQRTFDDYNIQQDATLHVVVASPDPIPVVGDGGFRLFIQIVGGTRIEVKTRRDATIGEIKGMISRQSSREAWG